MTARAQRGGGNKHNGSKRKGRPSMEQAEAVLTAELFGASTVIDMRNIVILLHTLPLALLRPLRDSLRKEGHELFDRAPLEEGE